MRKTAILVAAVMAIAILLAAGMTVLPVSASTILETQGNPCSTTEEGGSGSGGDTWIDCDFEGVGKLKVSQSHPCIAEQNGGDGDISIDCDFEGVGEIEVESEDTPPNGSPPTDFVLPIQ
jgi:hypothetical protein